MEEDNLNENVEDVHVDESQEAVTSASPMDENYGYARPEDFPEEPLYNVDHLEKEGEETEEQVEEQTEEEVIEEQEPQEESEQEYEEEIVSEEDDVYFEDVLSEHGLELEEGATLNDLVSHYKELLDSNEQEDSDLPNELQLAIDTYKNGGDYMKVLNTLSLDFDSMDGKELLRNKFIQDNQELYQKNQDLANKKFEREFATKYGILNKEFEDDFDKEQFMSENGDDYDYTKMLYDQELNDAKEYLNNWKQEVSSTEGTVRNEMSEEDRQEIVDKYYSEVDSALNEFGGIALPIDDNPDNDFTLGIDEESIAETEQVMKDPIEFFKEEIGYDVQTGEIDVERFLTTVHVLRNLESVGAKIGQYYLEKSDKQTVESMLENATDPNKPDQIRQPTEEDALSAAKAIRRALYKR